MRLTLLLSLVLTVAASVVAASAIQEPGAVPGSAAAARLDTVPPSLAIDETQTVPVPPPSDKALQFHRSGNLLWIVDQTWQIVMLSVILLTGLSARLRDWSQRIGRRWFLTLAVYWLLFTVLTALADLARVYY